MLRSGLTFGSRSVRFRASAQRLTVSRFYSPLRPSILCGMKVQDFGAGHFSRKQNEIGAGKCNGQLLADFSLLDLLVVVVSPPDAPLLEVVVEDSDDFSEADTAAGAAPAP